MNIAIILAGGIGSRMGIKDKPKQFIDIYGKPLILYSLEAFNNHPLIDYIAIVCLNDWHENVKILSKKYEINKLKWIVNGGKTRQESVQNGISAIKSKCLPDDILIIHDSARPLVTHEIITENINGANNFGAINTVIPATDTIIKSKDNKTIAEVPIRKELYLVQTPQTFKFSVLDKAHKFAKTQSVEDATDDCQLVLKSGHAVNLVSGNKLNFKVTTPEDLTLLKAILEVKKLHLTP